MYSPSRGGGGRDASSVQLDDALHRMQGVTDTYDSTTAVVVVELVRQNIPLSSLFVAYYCCCVTTTVLLCLLLLLLTPLGLLLASYLLVVRNGTLKSSDSLHEWD